MYPTEKYNNYVIILKLSNRPGIMTKEIDEIERHEEE